MPDPSLLKFTLAIDDFDLSLLPPEAQQRGTPTFRDAVKAYLSAEFGRFGGWSSIDVDNHIIEVSWTPDRQPADPWHRSSKNYNAGNIRERSHCCGFS